MTVEITGSQFSGTGTGDVDISSITVPADADCCVVLISRYDSTIHAGVTAVDQMDWDNSAVIDFTYIDTSFWATNRPECEAYYMLSNDANWPGSGSGKTLYTSFTGASDEGATVVVIFLKNVDTTGTIVDSEVFGQAVEGPSFLVSSLSGVGAGDMTMGVAYAYQQAPDADPTGYGQTSLEESTYNDAGIGIGYEVGETAFRFENCSFSTAIWFALKAAAAVSQTSSSSSSSISQTSSSSSSSISQTSSSSSSSISQTSSSSSSISQTSSSSSSSVTGSQSSSSSVSQTSSSSSSSQISSSSSSSSQTGTSSSSSSSSSSSTFPFHYETDADFAFIDDADFVFEQAGTSSSSSSSSQTGTSSSTSSSSQTGTSSSSSSSSISQTSSSSQSSSSSASSTSASSTSSSSSAAGWTWGEQFPSPEDPLPWSDWLYKESAQDAQDTGDWGKLQLLTGVSYVSTVKDFGNVDSKYLEITYDDYASGSGTGDIYWRGQATSFDQDDDEISGPTWEVYSPGYKSWRYVQVMVT